MEFAGETEIAEVRKGLEAAVAAAT
jgi:hypothetical protein